MSTPNSPDPDADSIDDLPDDWDDFDPEDTADRDGAEIDLDDIAEPLPEDGGHDIPERHVEERLAWQDYTPPPLD